MPKLELWLVRHGETVYNADRRLAGWADVALTPQGEAQARALGQVLAGEEFDGVWASDLQRTRHTARLAGHEPVLDERLREIKFGTLEGLPWNDMEDHHRDALLAFEGFRAPGGESLEDLAARVMPFVDGLPAGKHLIFTHGGVIRMLLRDRGLDRFVSPCTLVVVDWASGEILQEKPGVTVPLDDEG